MPTPIYTEATLPAVGDKPQAPLPQWDDEEVVAESKDADE